MVIMATLVIKNGVVVTPDETRCTNLWISQGLVRALGDNPPDSSFLDCLEVDARGCYVTPGLIDLQVNGSSDCNLWEVCDKVALAKLSKQMASSGVTTFLPTLITDDIDKMVKNQAQLNEFGVGASHQWSTDCSKARMPGIHLEGPFLSKEKPGVHPGQFIVKPTFEALEKLVGKSVIMMTLAWEQVGSIEVVDWLKSRNVCLSIGHSNATYEEANVAFSKGVGMVTHIFNAMTGIHHREPGLAGAALMNDNVSCCLIPDGLHLNKEIVKLVVRLKEKIRLF